MKETKGELIAQLAHDLGGGPTASRLAFTLVYEEVTSLEELQKLYQEIGPIRLRARLSASRWAARRVGKTSLDYLIARLEES